MKTLKLVAKKNMMCPKHNVVANAFANGTTDVIPFVVEWNNQQKRYCLYTETQAQSNFVGYIDDPSYATEGSLDQFLVSYKVQITNVIPNKQVEFDLIAETQKEAPKNNEEIEAEWTKVLALGGPFTEEFKKNVTEIFEDHKIDPVLQMRVLHQYCIRKDVFGETVPVWEPSCFYKNADPANKQTGMKNSIFSRVLRKALDGHSDNLIGPKSVGKNICAETLAYVLGMPYFIMEPNPQMLMSDWYGEKNLDDTARRYLTKDRAAAYLATKQNKATAEQVREAEEYEYWLGQSNIMHFIMDDTALKSWAKTSGGAVLMIDEINYGDPIIEAAVLNIVAEARKNKFLDIPGEGKLYIDPHSVLLASMNEGYVGTMEMNEAMATRFDAVVFPQPVSIEAQLKEMLEKEYHPGILADKYYAAANSLFVYMKNRSTEGGNGGALYGDKALSIRSFGRALSAVASGGGYTSLADELIDSLSGLCSPGVERASLIDDIREKIGKM